jgi:5-methylthioadenosine/S-adenosylhomocysteine deaminase
MKTLLKNVYLRGKIVDVLIEGNRFKKISKSINEPFAKIINCEGKAIEPAFYNCHTHISMTILKGIADDKELHNWLIHDFGQEKRKWFLKIFIMHLNLQF